ncbi:MAG: hypothetical protein LBP56_05245 [Odoribacteraceae bacterium]|jgi:hypothetical protein|nr:hypothetical protein [Odoribacteraceae bacterium]
MRLLVILSLVVSLAACRAVKKLNVETNEIITRVTDSVIIVIRDTTILYEPAPERSERETPLDSSYLETSLAWSIATSRDGILKHLIGNKPVVPVRVPLETREHARVQQDEAKHDNRVEIEITREKYRFMNPFFYASGWIGWIILIIITAWKIIRPRI